MQFKRFSLGCDLTEVVAGTCASDLELMDIYSRKIGFYAIGDLIGLLWSVQICIKILN